jgi:hypothetical protein
MYPDVAPPLILAFAEAVAWLFLYDDALYGDAPPQPQAVRGVMRARSLPAGVDDGGLLGCLAGLASGPLGQAPDVWWRRFSASVGDFADAMAQEAQQRHSGYAPSVAEYAGLRYRTSGWEMLADLAELSADGHVPARVRRALVRPAGDVAGAINDLLSLQAELSAGERHNMVVVLMQHDGESMAGAIGCVHGWLTQRLSDYLQAKGEQLRAGSDPGVAAFARAIEALVRGSLDWSLETGRYAADQQKPGEGAGP